MIQELKSWVLRSIFQGRPEDNTQSQSLGEGLNDLNEWRTGQYGWVTKGGKPGPYLQYIRELTALSNYHYLLADFMDVGTIHSRWHPNEPGGYPEDLKLRNRLKAERMRRTHVCLLEYPEDNSEVRSRTLKSPEELGNLLSSLQVDASLKLRLLVVEDLSREVIEALGHHLKIDPSFFRDHLIDSQFNHLDDEYRVPPRLRTSIPKPNWYSLRYVRARDFSASDNLDAAAKATEKFNVLRQINDDGNSNRFWDTHPGGTNTVGLIQSKATMWIQRSLEPNAANSDIKSAQKPSIAVLLVDPSIIEGNQLWRKTRNWTKPPEMGSYLRNDLGEIPEDNSFENFIYWAKKPEASEALSSDTVPSPTLIPTQILLGIVCNQWLTLVDYLRTRLNQIDWEIAFPDDFTERDVQMLEAHDKLCQWRQMLPVFRDMILDLGCLEDTIHDIISDGSICNSEHNTGAESKREVLDSRRHIYEWKNPYQLDISRLGDRMAEFDDQIGRIVKLLKPVACVNHGRVHLNTYRPTTRLLWLALFWLLGPFLASLCSMTTHSISELGPSLSLWAITAIPIMLGFVMGLGFYTA